MKKNILIITIAFLIIPLGVKAATACDGIPTNTPAYEECKSKLSKYNECLNTCNNNQVCKQGTSSDCQKCKDNCEKNNPTVNSSTNQSSSNSSSNTSSSGNNSTSSKTDNGAKHNDTIKGVSDDDIPKKTTCKTLFGGKTGELLKDAYKLLKFLVPILLIAMSIKDFGTVIISQDNDGMKKAINTFLKRLIVAVVILIAPTVIGYILKLLGIEGCLV